MEIREYNKLPVYSVEIRTQVFVKEQGFSKELEFDANEQTATHLVGFVDGSYAATCRYYFEESKNAYLIGRIAVLKKHRGKGLGAEIVKAAEERIRQNDGKTVVIHAQLQAKGFYEQIGYSAASDIDLEEGVEHIWMKKELNLI